MHECSSCERATVSRSVSCDSAVGSFENKNCYLVYRFETFRYRSRSSCWWWPIYCCSDRVQTGFSILDRLQALIHQKLAHTCIGDSGRIRILICSVNSRDCCWSLAHHDVWSMNSGCYDLQCPRVLDIRHSYISDGRACTCLLRFIILVALHKSWLKFCAALQRRRTTFSRTTWWASCYEL